MNSPNLFKIHIYLMNRPFIIIKTEISLSKIFIDEILYCKAEQSYTNIFLINRNVMICKILKILTQELQEYNFYRVNRSYLINLDNCTQIKKNKKLRIVFFNNMELEINARSIRELEKVFCFY